LAESELAILSDQCLDRRIPDGRSLERQVAAWLLDRNALHVKANSHFTAADARFKPKSLYPALLLIQATSAMAARCDTALRELRGLGIIASRRKGADDKCKAEYVWRRKARGRRGQ
jgi:hypothetical protein